jgi:hypothetical protein
MPDERLLLSKVPENPCRPLLIETVLLPIYTFPFEIGKAFITSPIKWRCNGRWTKKKTILLIFLLCPHLIVGYLPAIVTVAAAMKAPVAGACHLLYIAVISYLF